jgi:transporter family-2 protein
MFIPDRSFSGCSIQVTNLGTNQKLLFFTGAVTSLIYFLIEVQGRPPADLASRLAMAPWWAWTGGVIGALFVIINILTIPKLGAGTTSAIIVCSQLVFSCIIDNFQFFGIAYRTYTLWRGLATVGLIGCVAAIAKF